MPSGHLRSLPDPRGVIFFLSPPHCQSKPAHPAYTGWNSGRSEWFGWNIPSADTKSQSVQPYRVSKSTGGIVMENFDTSFELTRKFIDRRTFARRAAFAGLGVMGASFLEMGLLPAKAASPQNSLDNTCGVTALQVFTAALESAAMASLGCLFATLI
jgi:hypothetical protein